MRSAFGPADGRGQGARARVRCRVRDRQSPDNEPLQCMQCVCVANVCSAIIPIYGKQNKTFPALFLYNSANKISEWQ